MVRTISAVIIFTATIISCCISLNFLANTTSSITDNITVAQKFLKEEKMDLALKEVNLAKEKWENNKKIFKIYVDHTHLEEIDVGFAELEANLISEEPAESLAISENVIVRIKQLKETEEPSLENVL